MPLAAVDGGLDDPRATRNRREGTAPEPLDQRRVRRLARCPHRAGRTRLCGRSPGPRSRSPDQNCRDQVHARVGVPELLDDPAPRRERGGDCIRGLCEVLAPGLLLLDEPAVHREEVTQRLRRDPWRHRAAQSQRSARPADSLLPGQVPAQEAKWPAVGNGIGDDDRDVEGEETIAGLTTRGVSWLHHRRCSTAMTRTANPFGYMARTGYGHGHLTEQCWQVRQ